MTVHIRAGLTDFALGQIGKVQHVSNREKKKKNMLLSPHTTRRFSSSRRGSQAHVLKWRLCFSPTIKYSTRSQTVSGNTSNAASACPLFFPGPLSLPSKAQTILRSPRGPISLTHHIIMPVRPQVWLSQSRTHGLPAVYVSYQRLTSSSEASAHRASVKKGCWLRRRLGSRPSLLRLSGPATWHKPSRSIPTLPYFTAGRWATPPAPASWRHLTEKPPAPFSSRKKKRRVQPTSPMIIRRSSVTCGIGVHAASILSVTS